MRCWIAVAAADHVRFGRSAGFMQVSHGAAAPLRRIQPDDCVAYYSPTTIFRGSDRLQAFTAIGIAKPGAPYQVDMGDSFHPWRRDMRWLDSEEAPIRPLLDRLSFTRGNANWGSRLRFGFFEVSASDMAAIAAAMDARLPFPRLRGKPESDAKRRRGGRAGTASNDSLAAPSPSNLPRRPAEGGPYSRIAQVRDSA